MVMELPFLLAPYTLHLSGSSEPSIDAVLRRMSTARKPIKDTFGATFYSQG